MTVTTIIVGVIIGLIISYFLFNRRLGEETEIEETIEVKQDNLEKIVYLLKEKGEISNSEIREHLGVSGRTVVRYMDELEDQNIVEQVGKTGTSVIYRLK